MQLKIHMVTIEDLMPQDHFLRKLEKALDLSFVYEETRHLYSQKYGRPPIDPVVLVKYLLVGFLYGIPSERQIEKRIETDIALRWYLGLDLLDRVPDHSTISQLRRRKPEFRNVFRRLFHVVVQQCIAEGLVTGKIVATDSTHMKANASVSSECLVEVQEEPEVYWERLNQYEEQGLEKLKQLKGKRRAERKEPVKKKTTRSHKRVSRTDPEAGHMKRPGKPNAFCYLNHQTSDAECGIITDVFVTPGNVNDCTPHTSRLEIQIDKLGFKTEAICADAGYDNTEVYDAMLKRGIQTYIPKKRKPNNASSYTNGFEPEAFSYNPEEDFYVCPQGKILEYSCYNKKAQKKRYLAAKKDCCNCPCRQQCMGNSKNGRLIERLMHEEARQEQMKNLNTPEYFAVLRLRKIWCEGNFSHQKSEHNLRWTYKRGIERVTEQCLLSACAMNLIRLVKAAIRPFSFA